MFRTGRNGKDGTPMQQMSSRNQHFTDSVIRRMTRISNESDAINLALGFPDFYPPMVMTYRL